MFLKVKLSAVKLSIFILGKRNLELKVKLYVFFSDLGVEGKKNQQKG